MQVPDRIRAYYGKPLFIHNKGGLPVLSGLKRFFYGGGDSLLSPFAFFFACITGLYVVSNRQPTLRLRWPSHRLGWVKLNCSEPQSRFHIPDVIVFIVFGALVVESVVSLLCATVISQHQGSSAPVIPGTGAT